MFCAEAGSNFGSPMVMSYLKDYSPPSAAHTNAMIDISRHLHLLQPSSLPASPLGTEPSPAYTSMHMPPSTSFGRGRTGKGGRTGREDGHHDVRSNGALYPNSSALELNVTSLPAGVHARGQQPLLGLLSDLLKNGTHSEPSSPHSTLPDAATAEAGASLPVLPF